MSAISSKLPTLPTSNLFDTIDTTADSSVRSKIEDLIREFQTQQEEGTCSSSHASGTQHHFSSLGSEGEEFSESMGTHSFVSNEFSDPGSYYSENWSDPSGTFGYFDSPFSEGSSFTATNITSTGSEGSLFSPFSETSYISRPTMIYSQESLIERILSFAEHIGIEPKMWFGRMSDSGEMVKFGVVFKANHSGEGSHTRYHAVLAVYGKVNIEFLTHLQDELSRVGVDLVCEKV